MAESPLFPLIQKIFDKDPAATAHLLESMDEKDVLEILKEIPAEMSSAVVKYLSDGTAAGLLQKLPYPVFRGIVERLDPQQGSAIFFHFPEHLRHLFLLQLEEKRKKEIQEILTFPEDSAGRLMSTDFLALHGDLRVRDAVQKIRDTAHRGGHTTYAYVVDSKNCLAGVLNMRDMLLADDNAVLESIMRRGVFAVNCFMGREELASEFAEKRFLAVPVVDAENRLLGVVKDSQLIGEVQKEASEDFQKMFGAGGDEKAFSPVGFSLKKRLPWLYVNLATAFLAASVVALFEGIIAKITVLAVYLPVVAGQGGNAGAQSLAVVMRGLVMREIPVHKAKNLILKEAIIGLVNGILIGVVTAGIAWLWQRNPYLGLVIGLGMVVNLTIAGFSGAAIPVLMKSVGLDPAQCSNIILTTITDVMGFFSFLGFAVIFQNYLV